MTDLLIRGIPEFTLRRLDEKAEALEISRAEYVRRLVEKDALPSTPTLTMDDLRRAAELTQDLLDPEVMAAAWR
ncbi:MAG: antitoxin [Propionibacteriaceae bacterium]|nr:antitoxin [Propionibacteriaceae bacterium]